MTLYTIGYVPVYDPYLASDPDAGKAPGGFAVPSIEEARALKATEETLRKWGLGGTPEDYGVYEMEDAPVGAKNGIPVLVEWTRILRRIE